MSQALELQGLHAALEQYWAAPQYEETLALLISRLFEKDRVQEIDEGIGWLIEWGQKTHREDNCQVKHRVLPSESAGLPLWERAPSG